MIQKTSTGHLQEPLLCYCHCHTAINAVYLQDRTPWLAASTGPHQERARIMNKSYTAGDLMHSKCSRLVGLAKASQ